MTVNIQVLGDSLDAAIKLHNELSGDKQPNDKWKNQVVWLAVGYLSNIAGFLLCIAADIRAIRVGMERKII